MRLTGVVLAALTALPAVVECAAGRVHHDSKNHASVIGTTAGRPTILPIPKTTGKKFIKSGRRTHTCFVDALGNGQDDSDNILQGFKDCSPDGTVAMLSPEYIVGKALDLTFLERVDWDLQGRITFTDDTDYWQAHSFKYTFQNSSAFIQFGGNDVHLFGSGKGTLDGNGQAWYDLYAKDPLILRPILIAYNGLHDATVSGFKLRYSPQWYQIVIDSSNIIFDDIDIAGGSVSKNPAKNTDGWDTYRSDNIVIQNSHIVNGDDCVSFKPNSTNILVQGLFCDGSHGISVGSLGQYYLVYDLVENVYVYNISMNNASDMARIKVWPGVQSALSVDLQGGGGLGLVNNITYDTMNIKNVDYAIELTQCYGQNNLTLCNEYPSTLVIQDVVFKNMAGVASKKYDPKVGTLICSSPTVCHNIAAYNISVVPPSGKTPTYTCTNIDRSQLQINCV
ncbi:Exopolygalacturonase [Drechslerella dactyloides]|uniref:galacturonan 1,4-alpha-galacturonidase n=1 Tax=Drechslerella dactyloides TaxID=74499 RepID=A0AAD6NHJ6_DREDA|nr:Exopolygalacturonase [Drechslerella dactyloides]